MNGNELIKKIEEKIAELEKEESPLELLKRALLKKGITKSLNELSDEKLEELFKLLEGNI